MRDQGQRIRGPDPARRYANPPTHDWLKAFTLIELLVVIAIIALLAALLLPTLSRAKEKGRQAVCLNNMRQLALVSQLYIDDWSEWILACNNPNTMPGLWYDKLSRYLSSAAHGRGKVLSCPSEPEPYPAADAVYPPWWGATGLWSEDPDWYRLGYGYPDYFGFWLYGSGAPNWEAQPVWGLKRATQVTHPEKCAVVVDQHIVTPHASLQQGGFGSLLGQALPYGGPAWRHSNRANLLLFDGHAESFDANSAIAQYPWDAGFN